MKADIETLITKIELKKNINKRLCYGSSKNGTYCLWLYRNIKKYQAL